ncbi:MAG: hypothetical protein R2861_02085 [Desulfobacterales bacterium]
MGLELGYTPAVWGENTAKGATWTLAISFQPATNDGVGNNPIYCVAAAYQPVQYTICIISALNNPLRLVYGTVTIAIRYLKYFVSAYPLGTVIHMALTVTEVRQVRLCARRLRTCGTMITPYRRQWSTRKLKLLAS